MNITEDGNYDITKDNVSFSLGIIYVSGAMGSASVVVNSLVKGVLTPLTDGSIVSDTQYQINHGQQAHLVAVVSGANGSTDFYIEYRGVQ